MNNEKIIDTDRRRKLKGFLGIVKRVYTDRDKERKMESRIDRFLRAIVNN